MSNIPCSFDCIFQNDGECELDCPMFVSCENEKCPHFKSKNQEKKQSENTLPKS